MSFPLDENEPQTHTLSAQELPRQGLHHDPRHTPEEVALYRAFGGAITGIMEHQRLLFEHQQRHERCLVDMGRHTGDNLQSLKDELKEFIMTALDDLKKNIGDLIAEGTADITALVQRASQQSQQQGGASESDLQQLADNVAQATKSMHDAFMAATGTSVPSTAPSGNPSNATDSGSSSGSSSASPSPSEPPPATSPGDTSSQTGATSGDQSSSDQSSGTTIGPESFKSGA